MNDGRRIDPRELIQEYASSSPWRRYFAKLQSWPSSSVLAGMNEAAEFQDIRYHWAQTVRDDISLYESDDC